MNFLDVRLPAHPLGAALRAMLAANLTGCGPKFVR
jgi:hypothetical protein